ncbi:symmetrical bis(5'-nucleosyl)-tetraphosphatase [Alkalimonas collagenimarina]|uniref:bis(5'-nucleosyl)-tetraphosphatase (symmetrical) n=1 Tax=Alkalimonas collagenimarina TaxID=400390 RepID=A0ABT9GYG0_9GAMM|nr:symmetrical bis(5'-nucleosyl)-tetraphosphatase [Alkalimonas collagenimarina]MDP4536087.1 symmetrical bis(5'-nucleosyl)-tetraphosphatase [Alkalimonas collagenimarina]
MATYAIGDIQGCYDELQLLLEKIKFNQADDQLWLCGDLIARGPKSLETLHFIRSLGATAITVLGNHDLNLIASFYGYGRVKATDQLQVLQSHPDYASFIEWLCQQPLIHSPTETVLMVHAGIPPGWSRSEAMQHAECISSLLKRNPEQLCREMYGNEPARWQDAQSPAEQWRFTINALTRMRLCRADGALELTNKGAPQHHGALLPWYDFWPRNSETTLLVGHWAALNGNCPHPKVEALDTGCVWGNQLTAYCIQTKQRYSVSGYQK